MATRFRMYREAINTAYLGPFPTKKKNVTIRDI